MHTVNHPACTADAFQVFQGFTDITADNQDINDLLSFHAGKEDSITIIDGFQRLRNWHFFNNGNRIKRIMNSKILGIRTSEDRVNSLAMDLDESIEDYNEKPKRLRAKSVLRYCGRLIHHMQDMATPSHVVPVYHGGKLKDQYEVFCEPLAEVFKTDLVEKGASGSSGYQVTLTKDEINTFIERYEVVCQDAGDRHPLYTLYTFVASQTLEYLLANQFNYRENGEEKTGDWSLFWQENAVNNSSDHQGFGNFGPLGNNFGKAAFTVDSMLIEVVQYGQYLAFIKEMYKSMVLASIGVLHYAHRRSAIFSERKKLIIDGVGD